MRGPTAVIAEDEPLLRGELKETLAALWMPGEPIDDAVHHPAATADDDEIHACIESPEALECQDRL